MSAAYSVNIIYEHRGEHEHSFVSIDALIAGIPVRDMIRS